MVSLGSVFVYDAHGQPLPATMSVTRNSTRIVVNGDALARAAYPVTIDPEIGTNDFQISAMGTADDPATQLSGFDTAVAFNSTSGEYLVVWAGDNIAPTVDGESEIWGQRINAASGAKVGSQFRISNIGTASNTSFDALKPAVSYNSTNNEYLVVWTGDTNAGALVDGEFEIYGQRISASGAELGTNDFRISSSDDGFSYFDANEPDVTYNPTGNEYLVVWSGTITATNSATAEFEILGQRLNGATGAEVGTGDFRISDMAQDENFSFDAVTPAVTFNTTGNEYLVVWSGDDNTGALSDEEFEIFGQRLNSTGGAIGTNDFRISEMGADGNPLFQASGPDLSLQQHQQRVPGGVGRRQPAVERGRDRDLGPAAGLQWRQPGRDRH